MEAKDTVMSDEQLDEIGYPILPIGDRTGSRRVARAQAEISFKAGIKEVVEWIQNQDRARGYLDSKVISINELQAKLKEWGIS